ncbi:hypothetical protein JMJ78_0014318 [Colletotrichum scovillei]|nr:hypothetical protein JMJ78_0014318 [Colletotrichum scovillei]
MVRLFFFFPSWSPVSFSVYMPSRPSSQGSLPHVSMSLFQYVYPPRLDRITRGIPGGDP